MDAPVFGPGLGAGVQIVLRNTVHVTSQGGDSLLDGMRAPTVRAFLRGTLDRACAAGIPPLHTPSYAPAPATLVAGPDPGGRSPRGRHRRPGLRRRDLRHSTRTGLGPGLRGGSFDSDGDTFTLHDVRFVPGVRVNGSGRWDPSTGGARVQLTVGTVKLTAQWSQTTPQATVRIGDAVLSTPAP